MARNSTTKKERPEKTEEPKSQAQTSGEQKSDEQRSDLFQLRNGEPSRDAKSQVHLLGPGIICDTEGRGHPTPQGLSPFELVLHAPEGSIRLWSMNETLRWRFQERSMDNFANPTAAKREIRKLFGEALLAWDTAAPVKFTEDEDVWDFEFVMRSTDNCNANGCVLASAFFPDSGRHQLVMYPRLFTQSREEQVETFIHEIGHIFGLRHFFANISETAWPSEIFGEHKPFTIMNYGSLSALTTQDKDDLRQLYLAAWSGALTHINGTPIQFVRPFHTFQPQPDNLIAMEPVRPVFQPQWRMPGFART